MVPLRYNLRSLVVRKVTTAAAALGIALVVFVFAGALMLGEGVDRANGQSGRTNVAVVLRKGSDNELSSSIGGDQLNLLRGGPGIQMSAAGQGVIGELVIVLTPYLADGTGVSNLLVRGMPPEGAASRPGVRIVSGRAPKPGTNEAMVGKSINGRFKGVGLGQTFELRRNRPLHVVGVFEAAGSSSESEVWGDLDTIRNGLGRQATVQSARVQLTSASAFEGYRAAIEADKRMSVKVMREDDYLRKQSEDTAGFLSGLGLGIAILFSIAAMIGAAITMNGAIANRTKEIGTLRALGFSKLAILFSFLLEAMFLAFLGGAVGVVLVQLLALISFPVLNLQTFSEIVISFVATPKVIGTSLFFSIFMGLLGGLFPAIRAARISPVEAMRG